MNSDLPKVLHPVCGKPMLAHVLEACRGAGISDAKVVVGHGKDEVIESFSNDARIEWVEQREQLGTGHAVLMCEEALKDFDGNVVIVAGDMPLIRAETLRHLVEAHTESGAVLSLATATLDDPTGYGRITRDENGGLVGIVEQADCDDAQKDIREVNISYYCFDCKALFGALHCVEPNASKGEYYITDAVRLLISEGATSTTLPGVAPEDAMGVNSQEDLALVERIMQARAAHVEKD